MAAPRIVIGGGTGFIGRHLGKKLVSAGYNITNVSRMPGPHNMSWIDLVDNGLPENTMAVVNLAGQQFMDLSQTWNAGLKQNVESSRVYTNIAISKVIKNSAIKPKAYIAISGVGAYEPSESNKYDESSPTTGQDFFSKMCEKLEAAATADPPTRLVIIRSGAVLGREGGMIKNMFYPFFFGLGGRIGTGKQYLPWIHLEDLTNLIIFAIKNDVKGIINGVSPQIITNAEFTKAFAKAMKRPAMFPVPERIINVLLNKERAMILTRGQHVSPKRVLEYGFKYEYPDINDACNEIIKSHKKINIFKPKAVKG